MAKNLFHWADYLVFGLTLCLSVIIGIIYAALGAKTRDGRKTDEFLLAGRSMGVLPVSISIFVSWLSALSFLGDPVEVYYHGIVYIYVGIGYALACPVVAHGFAPFFYNLRITSVYEYIETRYHKVLRYVSCGVMLLMVMLYLGVVVYGPSVALSQVTGIPEWISILIIGAVATFYTSLGGMKAVLWVDTFQSLIMLSGVLALLILGANRAGGAANVWNIASDHGRLNFLKLDPDPYIRSSVWTYFFGGFFRVLVPYISNQYFVQRYSCLKNPRAASRAVNLNMPMYLILVLLFSMTGLVMFAYYVDCDPLKEGRISSPNQLVPLFMLDVLGFLPGVSGLFLACLFSASLSTLSSALNAVAANVLVDFIQPFCGFARATRLGDTASVCTAKIVSILSGIIVVLLSFAVLYSESDIFPITVKITGVFSSPIGALFFMGRLFPCVDSISACIGVLSGLGISIWWAVGAMFYPAASQALGIPVPICENLQVLNNSTSNFTTASSITLIPSIILHEQTSYSFHENVTTQASHKSFVTTDLYGISPLWFTGLGFITTIVIATFIASIKVCARKICCRGNNDKGHYHMGELIEADTYPYQGNIRGNRNFDE